MDVKQFTRYFTGKLLKLCKLEFFVALAYKNMVEASCNPQSKTHWLRIDLLTSLLMSAKDDSLLSLLPRKCLSSLSRTPLTLFPSRLTPSMINTVEVC